MIHWYLLGIPTFTEFFMIVAAVIAYALRFLTLNIGYLCMPFSHLHILCPAIRLSHNDTTSALRVECFLSEFYETLLQCLVHKCLPQIVQCIHELLPFLLKITPYLSVPGL